MCAQQLWARRGFTSDLQAVWVDSLCKHSLTQTKITAASPFIKNVCQCVRRLLSLHAYIRKSTIVCGHGGRQHSSIDINNAVNHLDLHFSRNITCFRVCVCFLHFCIISVGISDSLQIRCTEVSGVENIGQCGRLSQLG